MKTIHKTHHILRRGSVLLMTLVYLLLFGSLATIMVVVSTGNMQVENAELESSRALTAAESGMSYLLLQFKTIQRPIINEGSIASMASPSLLWNGTNIQGTSGNNGLAVNLAAALNTNGYFTGNPVKVPAGTAPLLVPALPVSPGNSPATFTLTVAWEPANPISFSGTNTSIIVLHLTSMGSCGNVQRTVTMDVWFQKTLKYAVYSNVCIQLGKNVTVIGDVASTYNGTGKGPPVQMISDWRFLSDMSALDTDLANFQTLLTQYDTSCSNRIDVRDPNSPAAKAAAAAGFVDRNGDGYIDDYDLALRRIDKNFNPANPAQSNLTTSEFNDSATGKPYDADLWNLIDAPLGPVNSGTGTLPDGTNPPWDGYGDGVIDNRDGYAKVKGSVKVALDQTTWQNNVPNWSAWGASFRDQFEGPVVPTDPTVPPVQFGVDFSSEIALTPQSFDTSGIASQTKTTTASVTNSGSTTTISNGTLTAAMANGSSVTEHSPASASSGWQATYKRPVFQNVNFNNVRIPKGLNAKFVNCTFNGYMYVDMNTKVVDPAGTTNTNSDGSSPDPSAGMRWSQKMISGSFTPDTVLTASNSSGFKEGNNLHFSDCTFNGVLGAATPSAYTHFGNSWEFDGNTKINNQVDTSVTIMAPNTNIEMGSFQAPGDNPSTLVGVVVAGNIDIRGSAQVDGSLIVAGNGASNTTLGYFGTTDSGQAVPPPSQLPAAANGRYGHLLFQYNPDRGMPNGIKIPLVVNPQYATYQIR